MMDCLQETHEKVDKKWEIFITLIKDSNLPTFNELNQMKQKLIYYVKDRNVKFLYNSNSKLLLQQPFL